MSSLLVITYSVGETDGGFPDYAIGIVVAGSIVIIMVVIVVIVAAVYISKKRRKDFR